MDERHNEVMVEGLLRMLDWKCLIVLSSEHMVHGMQNSPSHLSLIWCPIDFGVCMFHLRTRRLFPAGQFCFAEGDSVESARKGREEKRKEEREKCSLLRKG